jgi:hypothetical protein
MTSGTYPWSLVTQVLCIGNHVMVAQELLTLPEHLSSTPVFIGVRATLSLVLCVMLCGSVFVFFHFLPFLLKQTNYFPNEYQ